RRLRLYTVEALGKGAVCVRQSSSLVGHAGAPNNRIRSNALACRSRYHDTLIASLPFYEARISQPNQMLGEAPAHPVYFCFVHIDTHIALLSPQMKRSLECRYSEVLDPPQLCCSLQHPFWFSNACQLFSHSILLRVALKK